MRDRWCVGGDRVPAAADIPNGSHLQNPELPAGLVSKTQDETAKAISRGEQLWGDRNLGRNGLNCNVCHPSGAVTHPETYPKYKQQFGRVITVQEFINWCIVVALHGKSQELGGEVLTELEAYQAYKNRGQGAGDRSAGAVTIATWSKRGRKVMRGFVYRDNSAR